MDLVNEIETMIMCYLVVYKKGIPISKNLCNVRYYVMYWTNLKISIVLFTITLTFIHECFINFIILVTEAYPNDVTNIVDLH